MDLKYQIGTASALEQRQEQNAYIQAQVNAETARLNLFQAMENYDWAIKGLVSGS